MSEPMLGEIRLFSGTFEPRNWAMCDGRLISIQDAPALYSIVTTRYGGDGRVSFGIPDLRGRVPVGSGMGPGRSNRIPGQFGGAERVPLAVSQMPAHTHMVSSEFTGEVNSMLHYNNENSANSNDPDESFLAKSGGTTKVYNNSGTLGNMAPESISTTHDLQVDVTAEETGGTDTHENMQPWQCINYILAIDGLYPSRT